MRSVEEIRGYEETELVNLYHLARTALSGGNDGRYRRMLWASSEFAKANADVKEITAYKALDRALS